MKKRFTMLLAALMLLLPACGQGAAERSAPPPSEASALPAQTDAPSRPAGEPAPTFDPTATLEETVLVDESDVKITATGLKYTAYEVKVSLTLENNTDKNLSFRSGTLGYSCNSVNGYMVDGGYLNADVAAGKKSNESVAFDIGELSILGLPDIADIELGFDIADDHHETYLQTGPRQLKTSTEDSYDYGADTYRAAILDGGLAKTLGFTVDGDSGELQFDEKGVRVISQTLITNSSGEQALFVEVENTTGDTVFASVGDVAVNGLGVQSGTWSTDWVSPGKRRIISMSLSSMLEDSQRTAFGLEQIGAVSYSFGFKDMDGDALVLPKTLTLSGPGGRGYDPSGEEVYQENGVRIVYKGLVPDDFEYSDDIHILLLIENSSGQPLNFDIDTNSVSVNGYMTSALCYSRTTAPGGSAILDVELTDYSLEENGITGLEDITEVELTFEIRDDDYSTVAAPTVTFVGKAAPQ